jgi:hypothetical protein
MEAAEKAKLGPGKHLIRKLDKGSSQVTVLFIKLSYQLVINFIIGSDIHVNVQ